VGSAAAPKTELRPSYRHHPVMVSLAGLDDPVSGGPLGARRARLLPASRLDTV